MAKFTLPLFTYFVRRRWCRYWKVEVLQWLLKCQ